MSSCDHNRCGSLDEQLVSVSSNLATAESLMTEKDDELKVSNSLYFILTNCCHSY